MVFNYQPNKLVNTVVKSRMHYYDIKTQSVRFKVRPILIIAIERNYFHTDLTVLPISSVSNKKNIDYKFDISIGKIECPTLQYITKDYCHVRVHKPNTINSNNVLIESNLDNLKLVYPYKFEQISLAWSEFSESLLK